jgi:GntR family transcriptional regulator / MocR family aminotransferase
MRSVPDSEVPVTVHRDRRGPLHLQVAGQLRDAVRDGRLRSGHRLPSSRELARQLGVSRAVTQGAYDQLHAEGWIAGRVGSGTYVADLVPLARRPLTHPSRTPQPARTPLSLRPGIPYVDRAADPGWRRAWREVGAQPPSRGYADAAGLPELRAALAEHLGRVRGVACEPEQVVVTSGTTHGMRLLHVATREGGDRIGIEDPGYRSAVSAARDHGLEIVDCPVDADGLRVDALPDDLAAVYVTPSHQYPLGGRLPVARRNALVDWARRTGAVVLEDDYDSEFRFDVAPLPALAQLDLDRVVHLGTVAKTLTPALRFGWLVASEQVAEEVTAYRMGAGDWPSWPVQAAMLAMLRDGYLDRVVKRGRRRYAERCAMVCERLTPYGQIAGRDAGLHVTLLLADHLDDQEVVRRAAEAGVEVVPLSAYRRSVPGPPGLVIGYGAVGDDELVRALDLLVPILQDSTGTMES